MNRINWYKSQRVSFQEMKKDAKDTELAIKSINKTLAKLHNNRIYPNVSSRNAGLEWTYHGLPTYSVPLSSVLSLTATLVSSDVYVTDAGPTTSASWLSGHMEISSPFYAFYKSGDVRVFPAITGDFELNHHDVDVMIHVDASASSTDYHATLCFNTNLAYPTTSAEIFEYIDLSPSAEEYTSSGSVQTNDNDDIKPILFSDPTTTTWQDCLSVVFIKDTGSNDTLYMGYSIETVNNEASWNRQSSYELVDYTDNAGSLTNYSTVQHLIPIATYAALTGGSPPNNGDGSRSSIVDYNGSISGALHYAARHIGIDDTIFQNVFTGNDLKSYIDWLNYWLERYPDIQYLSGVSDGTLMFSTDDSSFSNEYISDDFGNSVSYSTLTPKFQFTVDLSAGNNFTGRDRFDNIAFGYYTSGKYHLFKAEDHSTWGYIYRWVTTDGFDISGSSLNNSNYLKKMDTIAFTFTPGSQPRNIHCLGSSGQAWVKLWHVISRLDLNLEPTDLSYNIRINSIRGLLGSNDDYIDYILWDNYDYGIVGNSIFYDTNYDNILDIGMSAFDNSTDAENNTNWIRYPSAAGSAMSAIYVMTRDATYFSDWNTHALTGVLTKSNEDLLTSADNNSLWTYQGILFGAYNQPTTANPNDFNSSLNYVNVTGSSKYIAAFENNLINPEKPKLRIHFSIDDGSSNSKTLSGRVGYFSLINDNLEIDNFNLAFNMPLVGASGSNGWIVDVVPIESDDPNNWYCMALENTTTSAHIYKIGIPNKLFGWRK